MRSKKRTFIFDEQEEAEKIINEGFETGLIDYRKMYIIAKYFRAMFGYGAVRLERELIKFCKEHDPNFNPVTEAELIKRWIRIAMKFPMRKVEDIIISQEDIDRMMKIENTKDRKIIFATFVLAKVIRKEKSETKPFRGYCIYYSNLNDVINMAKLSNTKKEDVCLAYFRNKGFINPLSPETETFKIITNDTDETMGFTIGDLDKVHEYYTLIFGKDFGTFVCSVCGKEVVKTSNKQKYCKDCLADIKRKQTKARVSRYRTNVTQ